MAALADETLGSTLLSSFCFLKGKVSPTFPPESGAMRLLPESRALLLNDFVFGSTWFATDANGLRATAGRE